jgi:hypothetical protein
MQARLSRYIATLPERRAGIRTDFPCCCDKPQTRPVTPRPPFGGEGRRKFPDFPAGRQPGSGIGGLNHPNVVILGDAANRRLGYFAATFPDANNEICGRRFNHQRIAAPLHQRFFHVISSNPVCVGMFNGYSGVGIDKHKYRMRLDNVRPLHRILTLKAALGGLMAQRALKAHTSTQRAPPKLRKNPLL